MNPLARWRDPGFQALYRRPLLGVLVCGVLIGAVLGGYTIYALLTMRH